MRNYKDNDLNRIMEQADSLLADIQLYETPQEEQARKKAEQEQARKKAEQEQAQRALAEAEAAKQETIKPETQEPEIPEMKMPEPEVTAAQITEAKIPPESETAEAEVTEAETKVETETWQANEHTMKNRWDAFLAAGQETDEEAETKKKHSSRKRKSKTVMQTEEPIAFEPIMQTEESKEASIEETVEKPIDFEPVMQKQEPAEEPIEKPIDFEPVIQKKESKETPIEESIEKAIEKPIDSKEVIHTKHSGSCSMRTMLFSMLSFVFMEVAVRFGAYHSISSTILYPILFAAAAGCLVAFLASLFPKRINTILYALVLVICGCYGDVQIIHHEMYGEFLPLALFGQGIMEIFRNKQVFLATAGGYVSWLVVMFLPLILWIAVLRNKISFEPESWYQRLILVFSAVMLGVLGVLTLDMHGYEEQAPYVTFYHFDSQTRLEAAGKDLGLTATTVLELVEAFR